jgi:hypothetical protein
MGRLEWNASDVLRCNPERHSRDLDIFDRCRRVSVILSVAQAVWFTATALTCRVGAGRGVMTAAIRLQSLQLWVLVEVGFFYKEERVGGVGVEDGAALEEAFGGGFLMLDKRSEVGEGGLSG